MEQAIRAELWEVLDTSDLDSITSKEIRQALELRLGCPLQQYRDFIDNQMLLLMAQQDRASRIFPTSTWALSGMRPTWRSYRETGSATS